EDEDAAVDRRTVWALEAALNRFTLMEEAFGDRATLAGYADCARWDAYLIETAGAQALGAERLAGTPRGSDDGEWEARCRLAGVLERLKLPVRIEAQMQANVAEGLAAFRLTVPTPRSPARRWVEGPAGAGWEDVLTAEPTPRRAAHMHFAWPPPRRSRPRSSAASMWRPAARGRRSARRARCARTCAGRRVPCRSAEAAYYQVALTRRPTRWAASAAPSRRPRAAARVLRGRVRPPGADPFALMQARPPPRGARSCPSWTTRPPQAVRPVLGTDDARDLGASRPRPPPSRGRGWPTAWRTPAAPPRPFASCV
ncbi:MAG: hypothetical protein ACLSVD_13825, partial [Eggerthellaceae bacterium]